MVKHAVRDLDVALSWTVGQMLDEQCWFVRLVWLVVLQFARRKYGSSIVVISV
jgi:hypothetical protein